MYISLFALPCRLYNIRHTRYVGGRLPCWCQWIMQYCSAKRCLVTRRSFIRWYNMTQAYNQVFPSLNRKLWLTVWLWQCNVHQCTINNMSYVQFTSRWPVYDYSFLARPAAAQQQTKAGLCFASVSYLLHYLHFNNFCLTNYLNIYWAHLRQPKPKKWNVTKLLLPALV